MNELEKMVEIGMYLKEEVLKELRETNGLIDIVKFHLSVKGAPEQMKTNDVREILSEIAGRIRNVCGKVLYITSEIFKFVIEKRRGERNE